MPKSHKTRCPLCNATVPPDATLCPQCGTHLLMGQESKQCPDCGARLDAGALACPICGASFEQARGLDWARLGFVIAGLAILVALSGYAWRSKPWEKTKIALGPTGTPTLTRYPTWTPSPTFDATATLPATVTPTATATPVASPTPVAVASPTELPTVEPTPEPTLAPPEPAQRYAVEAGDNPGAIARKFGISLETLLALNGLTERSILQVGQELVVAQPGQAAPAATPMPSPTPTATAVPPTNVPTGAAVAAAKATAPASAVAPTPGATATPAPLVHVVGPGDMLGSLAVKYDVDEEEIAAANDITLRTILRVGQELVIPGKQTTPTATSTAQPTPTPSATATPTLTPFSTRASKPGVPVFPYRSVIALAPVDGSAISGALTPIVLNWTTAGILSEKEWYQVSLWAPGNSEPFIYYTKATSWRVEADLYRPDFRVRDYFWQVRVAYRPATEGNDLALSPPSERFMFQWK